MKWIVRGVAGLVAAAVLFFAVLMGASELGGEVVTLHTQAADGSDQTTSLWVVEDDGALWLRAGLPTSGWLLRLQAAPEVTLERAGQSLAMRAEALPERREDIHRRMREEYGWADALIGATRDGSGSVPVRLVPR